MPTKKTIYWSGGRKTTRTSTTRSNGNTVQKDYRGGRCISSTTHTRGGKSYTNYGSSSTAWKKK